MNCVKNDAQEGMNASADEKLCWLAYGDKNIDTNNKLAIVCSLYQRFIFHFINAKRIENETSNNITAAVREK